VAEETGAEGALVGKLGDVRYVYTRRGGERVFKVVSFYLFRYSAGAVAPLDEAPRLLAYGGERDMAERARALLESDEGAL
jgi:hypothetical protein